MNIKHIIIALKIDERIPFHTTFIFIKECISTFRPIMLVVQHIDHASCIFINHTTPNLPLHTYTVD